MAYIAAIPAFTNPAELREHIPFTAPYVAFSDCPFTYRGETCLHTHSFFFVGDRVISIDSVYNDPTEVMELYLELAHETEMRQWVRDESHPANHY